MSNDKSLADWQALALSLEEEVRKTIIGQDHAVRLINTAIFARGHVLLEGDVGVGKTTLLRTVARAIGGEYERIEGTVDLMPSDLVYYTYLNEDGKPRVDPGPLLRHQNDLSIFFFNEINRARPQVHSLMLRAMAERSVTAFNREYSFPHKQVFADRNRLEKEETFELPSAARDRFLMEILIQVPAARKVQAELMFDPRFHDTDSLIAQTASNLVSFTELNTIAARIQSEIQASNALRDYALDLAAATRKPADFGISISDTDMNQLVMAGMSPRGMSMMLQAARVAAWLAGREAVAPEDIHAVFNETVAHRVFFNPVYELRRSWLAGEFMDAIRNTVSAP